MDLSSKELGLRSFRPRQFAHKSLHPNSEFVRPRERVFAYTKAGSPTSIIQYTNLVVVTLLKPNKNIKH